MANLIQATVYQVDGSPLPEALTLDFQTSNLAIREASIVNIPEVNSAILYYNLPNNQLSVQTFYVGELIADLVASANVGTTTQLQVTVLEINKDPQIPGGVQYSFPANQIVIGESVNAVTGVNSYIRFKDTWYYVSELQSDLLVSGNGASAYKVYTALLTQNGTSSELNKNSGNLTIGVTYRIDDNSGGADFTNVGAPNNDVGTYFVATGLTPNSYGTGGLTYDPGAPVVIVLENTIGNVWWTYEVVGEYFASSGGLFTFNKTYVDCKNIFSGQWEINVFENYEVSPLPDSVGILNYNISGGNTTNGIDLARIEIRVYN
jgi:hypothetical protein